MDDLRRPLNSFVERWQRMNRGQRTATLALVVASAVGIFFFSSDWNSGEAWVSVAGGRTFTQKEIVAIESAWQACGLKQFRRRGNSLQVSKTDLVRYESAMTSISCEKSATANEWDKQLSQASVFTPPEQLEQLRENALRNEVRRVLIAIPAIADAGVNWARSKSRSAFGSRQSVKATVNVTPRDGYDLTAELAQSLRAVVASMVADLNPEDVVVLDQSSGLAITDSSAGELEEQQRRRKQQRLARQTESGIRAALAPIPEATAHLEAASSETNGAANSEIWIVRVEVPLLYLDALAAQQIVAFSSGFTLRNSTAVDLGEWRERELSRLRQTVQSLLPRNLPVANILVEFASNSQLASASSNLAFAAWPHAICGLCGVLLIAGSMLVRPRRRNVLASRTSADVVSQSSPMVSNDTSLASNSVESNNDLWQVTASVITEAPCRADAACERPRESQAISRLQKSDPRQLAEALRHERPQTIAVLLTRISDRLATACLFFLPDVLQRDVIQRLKSLGDVSPDLSDEIVAAVTHRLESNRQVSSRNRIAAAWASPRVVKVSA